MTLDEARLDLAAGLGLLLADDELQQRICLAMVAYENGRIVVDDLEHVTALAVGRLVAQQHPDILWVADRWRRHFLDNDATVPDLKQESRP